MEIYHNGNVHETVPEVESLLPQCLACSMAWLDNKGSMMSCTYPDGLRMVCLEEPVIWVIKTGDSMEEGT